MHNLFEDDVAQVGKVNALRKHLAEAKVDMDKSFLTQTSMVRSPTCSFDSVDSNRDTHAGRHTASRAQPTGGWPQRPPLALAEPSHSHPHRSDANNEFTVVHNGIITNYKELRLVLEKRGYTFDSDTDTEVAAVLTKYLFDSQTANGGRVPTFTSLIKSVVKELEGAFAFVFKSTHYPDELVVCRRGSPVLIGVKTEKKLKVDFVDVELPSQSEGAEKLNESRAWLACQPSESR
jgi:glucosamine--fructose-6-phosphate aminotransferase (isomerizing)